MVQRLSERAKTDLALSRGGKEEKGGRAHESKGKKKGTDQTHTKGGKREETLRTWRGGGDRGSPFSSFLLFPFWRMKKMGNGGVCALRLEIPCAKKGPTIHFGCCILPPPWCRGRNFGRRGLLCLVVPSQTTCAYKYSRRQRCGDKEEGI